jgi:ribonuclease HII
MPDWRIEKNLWKKGFRYVAGIDEAGRGPIAGPVFASAVIFEAPIRCRGIDDCKRLKPQEREKAYDFIRKNSFWSVGVADEEEIRVLNILGATKLAMKRAILALPVEPDALIIDGNIKLKLGIFEIPVIRGDGKSMSIASASIVAKVERDRFMERLDMICPGYLFSKHKGYPTKEHRKILSLLGPSPYHRTGFRLLK